jgi:hypothetical protein
MKVALNAPRSRIDGDFRRLQQVVWNVLKNASKFSPRDADILVTSSNEGNLFRMVVADTGIGIEAEKLANVFDAFTQGSEAVTRKYGGLGLGLAISKATIDAHGGAISAESAGANRGTTVTLTLPLAEERRHGGKQFVAARHPWLPCACSSSRATRTRGSARCAARVARYTVLSTDSMTERCSCPAPARVDFGYRPAGRRRLAVDGERCGCRAHLRGVSGCMTADRAAGRSAFAITW